MDGVQHGEMLMDKVGSPYGPFPELPSGKLLQIEDPLEKEMQEGDKSRRQHICSIS